jgi:hypothetical protein
MENDIKGNSNVSKESSKNIKPVTTNVTVKKQSEVTKFKKQLFAEDSKSVKGHIVTTVLLPGIQRLMADAVKNGIDWLIYGSKGGTNRPGGIRNVSYQNYYNRTSNVPASSPNRNNATRPGAYSVNEVTFNDRGEAEETLARMRENVESYGMVSVADFYDMVGVKHAFTDNKYGWKSLGDTQVVRNRDGYSIQFPKSRPIE